jgi:hypothetical protein
LKSLRIDFGEGFGCRVHDMVPRCISLNTAVRLSYKVLAASISCAIS